jgi:hypothetical protein
VPNEAAPVFQNRHSRNGLQKVPQAVDRLAVAVLGDGDMLGVAHIKGELPRRGVEMLGFHLEAAQDDVSVARSDRSADAASRMSFHVSGVRALAWTSRRSPSRCAGARLPARHDEQRSVAAASSRSPLACSACLASHNVHLRDLA